MNSTLSFFGIEVVPSAFQQGKGSIFILVMLQVSKLLYLGEKILLNDFEEPRLIPYDLPAGYDFEWTTLDLQDSQQVVMAHLHIPCD
jgi:hypothetical protein